MPLPKKGTPEWDQLCTEYLDANTPVDRATLVQKHGYRDFASFSARMRERGVYLLKRAGITDIPSAPEMETLFLPYPKFKIKPFNVGKVQRDEEDIGIVFADHHAGKITESYSADVYEVRMDSLLGSVMDIINLHRPIRNAYILNVGDNIQGESAYQGSKIGETDRPARAQIRELAVPTHSKFVVSLKQGVKEVFYHGVRGNHGCYDKRAPAKTNWDLFFYDQLAAALQNQTGIKVDTSEEFYQLIYIRGFGFFIIHGDQVRSVAGIPLFALRRKYQEYFAVWGFHYAYCGHWHSKGHDDINTMADHTICPPLVTGDSWALEVVGRASKPMQLVFGVHPRYGRTWQYNLYADKKFLPVPTKISAGVDNASIG